MTRRACPPATGGSASAFGRWRRGVALLFISLVLTAGPALAAQGGDVVRVYGVEPQRIDELRRHGDVWGRDWQGDYVVMQVAPGEREALARLGYLVETDVEESERVADFLAIDRELWQLLGVGGIPGYPCYRTVDETHATLEQLVAAHPQHARLELIGQSWQAVHNEAEGDIFALVIGNQASAHEQASLLVMAAQHARELTTAEAATRFAELLLEARETDGDVAWLLDHREIHVIAQQNPDGRRRVEQGQTSWRKNHNSNACGGGAAPGVDLNRNSPLFWGTFSSGNACFQTYRGVAPSSEPETIAVESYMEEVFERQWPPDPGAPPPSEAEGVFLSLHSFGRMVLLPWEGLGGQNENNAPNHDQLTILGRKLGFHTDYAVARWQLLGPAGGTTVDYAYGEFGVASYTLELGTSFLQPCGDFESTIWPAMRQTLLYAAKAAERPYQAAWGPDILALEAAFDPSSDQIELSAVADGTRYFRGNVTEPPAQDPIFAIVSAVGSLDVPPHLAGETFSLTLDGSGSVVDLSGVIPPPADTSQRRLLFVTATDAGGHTGPPTAVWVGGLGEAVAAIEPESLSLEVPSGESAVETLEITNLGTADLHWSIELAAIGWSDVTVPLLEAPAPTCDGGSEVPWLDVDPSQGTTPPGSSVPVGVEVDATELGEGLYEAALCIATNDPARPMVAVPVELTVTPSPCPVGPSELALEGITVDGPELYEACVSITVGPGVTVAPTGQLTLRAGQSIILRDGLAVEAGGALSAEIDPDLLP